MTARPFSRIEPISVPADPAKHIASFFTLVAGVGALPGGVGALYLVVMLYATVAEAQFAAAAGIAAAIAYAGLGFAQLTFYLRRAVGSHAYARRWWVSSYLYNLVPLGVALAVFVNEPHVGSLAASAWFAGLSTLAIVAYANEPRSTALSRPR